MKKQLALAAVAALVFGASPAFSAVESYEIDSGHSGISFAVRHLFTKTPGRFAAYSGTFAYDPADFATAKVKAEIDAASVDTNSEKRDGHLKSPDFFDVVKYPTITFASTSVKTTGKDTAQMMGDLTMHGVTKPVELKVTRLGGMNAFGGYRAGFEATGTLNRKDFGIVWNKTLDGGGFVLGEEVEITIAVEAVREDPEPAAAPAAAAAGAAKTK